MVIRMQALFESFNTLASLGITPDDVATLWRAH